MLIVICSVIGLILWLAGVVMAIILLSDTKISIADRICTTLVELTIMGLFGMLFSIGGITNATKNFVTTYEVPTSIIKTNNVTIVSHMVNTEVVIRGFVDYSASYYNATNIMIEVVNGDNFWNFKVNPTYSVVLK